MVDKSKYPWGAALSDEDFITQDHTYDATPYLPLFEKRVFKEVSNNTGDVRYYVYDPTEHGFPKDQKYPMIFALHGANGSLQNEIAIDWAGVGMFASPSYQEKLGGCYIVCPLANEKETDHGTEKTWMTARNETDLSQYDEAVLKEIEPLLKDAPKRRYELLGTDSIYSDILYEILHSVLNEYSNINKVVLFGTSAGGYMAWRMLINHPEDYCFAVVMAGAYLPTWKDLDKINEAKVHTLICHGKHDEAVDFNLCTKPNICKFNALPMFETYFPELVRCGDHGVLSIGEDSFQMGQHCINNAVQQNLIYDDGTPYDERFPEGIIGLIKKYTK